MKNHMFIALQHFPAVLILAKLGHSVTLQRPGWYKSVLSQFTNANGITDAYVWIM